MSDTMSAASMVGVALRRIDGFSSSWPWAESVMTADDWPEIEPGSRMSSVAARSTMAASGSPLNVIDPSSSSNWRFSVSTVPRTRSIRPKSWLDSAYDRFRASTSPRNSMSNGSPASLRSHTFCSISTVRA